MKCVRGTVQCIAGEITLIYLFIFRTRSSHRDSVIRKSTLSRVYVDIFVGHESKFRD